MLTTYTNKVIVLHCIYTVVNLHSPHLRMIHRKCDLLYVLRHAYIFVHVQDLSKTKWDTLSTNMDRLNDAVHTLYTLYMSTTILSPSIYNSPFPYKLEILTVHSGIFKGKTFIRTLQFVYKHTPFNSILD